MTNSIWFLFSLGSGCYTCSTHLFWFILLIAFCITFYEGALRWIRTVFFPSLESMLPKKMMMSYLERQTEEKIKIKIESVWNNFDCCFVCEYVLFCSIFAVRWWNYKLNKSWRIHLLFDNSITFSFQWPSNPGTSYSVHFSLYVTKSN